MAHAPVDLTDMFEKKRCDNLRERKNKKQRHFKTKL